MRKRLSAFLLAGILFFAGGAESVSAAQMSGGKAAQAAQTEVAEDANASKKAGGLRQTVVVEVDTPEPDKIVKDVQKKGSKVYNHLYDKYSTNFYYNQLNSDERALWDALDSLCLRYLSGMESLPADDREYDAEWDCYYYIMPYVAYSASLSRDRALTVTNMFKFSNPQYYFLQSALYTSRTYNIIAMTMYDAFGDGSARADATSKMFSKVSSWMAQINQQPNEMLKEKMAHDLICENIKYDPGYPNVKDMDEYNQSAWSVFMRPVTVCAGYSQAMQLLMNGAGIDCGVVTSKEHEWNIINIDNTWYYVDCTWDDWDGDYGYEVVYNYFNRTKSQYLRTDDPNYVHHTVESYWNPYLPDLDVYDSGATRTDCGTVNSAIGQLTAPEISISGGMVTLTAPKGDIYYTLNDDDPRESFTRSLLYTEPFKASNGMNIKAAAVASGCRDSSVTQRKLQQVTVKFNANGGYLKKKSVKSKSRTYFVGEDYGKLDTPKRSGGYAFVGWYTKKSGGKRMDSTSKVSGKVTLYAHWAKMRPKNASISKLKSSRPGEMTVTIKKDSSASGYQIKYSLKKSMVSAKTRTVSTNSATIAKLKKKKTYYVQVRMYQKDSVSGKKQYGAWSKVKKVKIKNG